MFEGFLLIGAVALFLVGTTLRKVSMRARSMSKPPTYSNDVDPAAIEAGIYVEHGMVNASDGLSIRPQYKRSEAFYEALI